ncbi:MAG: Rieske (2Fe-2S) protein [Lysobacter sp.]|nr:Rieske (2Fe-2S) protein [Lysobacter sp.]MDQ3269270.1 Rieske 2Fe-2S domain-containing protein [Pseudomonadota bacterium]
MSGGQKSAPAADDNAPQALVDFMENEAWEALVADVGVRLEALDQLPDSEIKAQVYALLQGIDAIHREGLHRLVRLFKEGVLEKVITDPAIHTLMELYDLLPVADSDPPPADTGSGPKTIPIKVLAPTVARPAPAPAPASRIPHWIPALLNRDELGTGGCVSRSLDGVQLLLCRVDHEVFALDAQCAQDGASLAQASLQRYTLVCPSHAGCYYDIRQGSRLGGGDGVRCHPVRTDDDGRVLVGFGMPFEPKLPSF